MASVSYKRGTLKGVRERDFGLALLEVKTPDVNRVRRLEHILEADPAVAVMINDRIPF